MAQRRGINIISSFAKVSKSRLSLICRSTSRFSCWSIGTARLSITSLKFAMATREKLWVSDLPHEWLCNREIAVVQNVSGDRNSLSSLEPFFPHSIPKQTQAYRKLAPSTYFEYASQGKRTNHSGLNLRCFLPVSEETGNS